MDNREVYVPAHKSDFDCIEQLKYCSEEEILKVSPDLLQWVQDINWPIAMDICKLLIPLDKELIGDIKTILRSDDLEWIENCLIYIVQHMSNDALTQIKADLSRISNFPSKDETEMDLHQTAHLILNKLRY